MPITEQQLLQILPKARPVAGIFLPALNRAMARWRIDSRIRQAAFLAQVGHESGQLRNLVENLNYSADALVSTWPSRFSAQTAPAYARQPEKIANKVYGGRIEPDQAVPAGAGPASVESVAREWIQSHPLCAD